MLFHAVTHASSSPVDELPGSGAATNTIQWCGAVP
jgi:hypothetical protein